MSRGDGSFLDSSFARRRRPSLRHACALPSPAPDPPLPCAPSAPPLPRSRRFGGDFHLPAGPCLAAWSLDGPGHALGSGALAACASGEQAALLMRKFVRDTWDDPSGDAGAWQEAEHGAWVDEFVDNGLGV